MFRADEIIQRERTMWHLEHSTGEFRLCRNKVAVAAQSQSSTISGACLTRKKSNEVAMTATNKIEKLLPWHATGTLSRRDADRVEQALAWRS